MRRFFATLDAVLCAIGRWLIQPLGTRIAVVTLLSIHAGLLAYSATRHSPTHLEPAFLASGISHWQFGRFELYRVNPPLPRMIAALPVLAVGCETDWSRFYDFPGSRSEFPVGEDFIRANGPQSITLMKYARWACIPFSLIGGYFAFCWASDLYGDGGGLLTLCLWTFEPSLLAHAELVTPDCACWSFGLVAAYAFWRWLTFPIWTRAGLAGLALGLAELTKLSWIILFVLWPMLWLAWRSLGREFNDSTTASTNSAKGLESRSIRSNAPKCGEKLPPALLLAVILLLAGYVLNLGYGFDGTFSRLKSFSFVSRSLSDRDAADKPGNRFECTWLAEVPLPLPRQYVFGIDSQVKDLEDYDKSSYLAGEWRDGGWLYYYLYGLLVKIPCGTWGLLALVGGARILRRRRVAGRLRDDVILMAPAVALFTTVSSQTEFNIHLRYVFPTLALTLVYLGQAAQLLARHGVFLRLISGSFLGYSVASGLLVYPNHLAYFNDFAGGPRHGHRHLLGSSFDWKQFQKR